jgi:hypothetical protein
MPDPKQPRRPKTTEEILAEMESMSSGIGAQAPEQASAPVETHPKEGGALKSLLGFFVKVVPEEEEQQQATPPAKPQPRGASPSPPAASATRTGPRVSDLVSGEASPQFKVPSAATGNLANRPFEQIYKEARLPDSPFTVDELGKLLENPTVASQPLAIKVVAVNLTLSAKGIGPDVPITDAVRRDRALDAYQQMLDKHAEAAEQRTAVKIEQITKETEEYLKRKQAEIEALRAETADARRESIDFSVRREAEEKRLAELISPFLEGTPNPVTVGNKPGESQP